MTSLYVVLGLVGIKVKFPASPICFQPVCGLCAYGQQFSSGGGQLPVKITSVQFSRSVVSDSL